MAQKKKTQPAEAPAPAAIATANWNFIFKWLFIIGGVTAGVTNVLAFQPDLLIWSLMVIGVILGIFYFDSNDLLNLGLFYLIFGAVANAVGGFYQVGPYVGGFFLGFFYYLGPIVLTVAVVYFVKKYILSN